MGCWLALVKQMLPPLIELLAKVRPEFELQTTRRPAMLKPAMQQPVGKGMSPECRQILQNPRAQAKPLPDSLRLVEMSVPEAWRSGPPPRASFVPAQPLSMPWRG